MLSHRRDAESEDAEKDKKNLCVCSAKPLRLCGEKFFQHYL